MRKITFLILLFMIDAFTMKAQLVINGQMEDWTTVTGAYTYDSLHNWKTTEMVSLQNSGNANHSAQKETSDVYEGAASLRLTSWSTTGFPINGLPGCASNGDVVVVTFPAPSITPVGGVPDTMRHAALSGYYEYVPMGSDHGSIETCLFKWNGTSRDTVAYGKLDAGLLIGSYVHFTIPLTEVLTIKPDTSLIWIQSSPRTPIASGVTGSVMRVDSLYYNGLIGIDEFSPVVKGLYTYPIPAATELNVKVELTTPVDMTYDILDVNGKLVESGKMNGNTQHVNVSAMAAGNYFITLKDESGKRLCGDQFKVVH